VNRLLETHELSRKFGGVRALDGVNLAVERGEAVGIIGPNGSGKTTFLNVVCGYLRPSGGRVIWKGQDVTSLSCAGRSRRGLVRSFQQMMVFPKVSVLENLQTPGVVRRSLVASRGEVLDLLARVGAPADILDKNAGDVSWGQGRLLGVALALACDPDLMLLDEPLGGLSPPAALHMVDVLRGLHAEGLTIVIVDHEVNHLSSICDRLVLFNTGRKVADGEPHALMSSEIVRQVYFGDL
jgi:branched-chain amino acid transport system ATP-binding protein